MEKQRLIELIDRGLSIREIAVELSSAFSTIRYWMKKYGLKTNTYNQEQRYCKFCGTNALSGRKRIYCSLSCQAKDRNQELVERWKSKEICGHSGKTMNVKIFVRRHMLEKAGNKCSKCGWNTPHPISKTPPLEINHIDGDASNTWEENLEVLCPNCHALTPNYKNRNKNGKRGR